ncbi:MAG: hypothetical protein LBS28_04135 [Streptococcaceae bacterium]|jgi:hypothetical protein|nr:hypothetical protein [Streptococcaceae bacterium]
MNVSALPMLLFTLFGIQGCYYAGQNPFASPLHISRNLQRLFDKYSLNQDNCRILMEFAAPIIMQLAQTLKER